MKVGRLNAGERLCAIAMLVAAAFVWWAHASLDRNTDPFSTELHAGEAQ